MKKFFASFLLAASLAAAAADYTIDTDHSSVTFKIKHLAVSTVTGRFGKFSGTVDLDPANLKSLKTTAAIEIASVNTDNEKRDEHLRGPDFLDAAKFPQMTFLSKEVKDNGNGKLSIVGDLTLHGVTKPVTLDVQYSGAAKSPMGGEVVGLTASTTINRQDFGINFDKKLDSGGLMIGNEVRIEIEIEAAQKK